MSLARRAAGALTGVLCADLLLLLVTGSFSLLDPGGGPPPAAGVAWRCGALAVLFVLRVRVLAEPALRLAGPWVLLALLLLPTLAQFQLAGGRLGGDGVMYYVYVRSLVKDGDFDLANEYEHYGLLGRGDLAEPTATGLRRSIFSVGPALLAAPFFVAGEAVARAQALAGLDADLSGYGPAHRNAVALGNLLYGFAALLLIHALLRRHFLPSTALLATLLLWGASFLHWYMVQQPAMSHAPSACMAALVLWLWDRERGRRDAAGDLLLGLLLGLAMCVRWQNGVLLLLPGFELLGSLRRARSATAPALGGEALGGAARGAALSGPALGGAAVAGADVGGGAIGRQPLVRASFGRLAGSLGRAAALAAGTLLGALPQLAAWKAIYGSWLLASPPHGADFLRLDHPFVLETLFSSRHGLLSWTPALWLGYLGFLPLLRRRRGLAVPLLAPLAIMTYVNFCSGDWWAGGSFSNRRFDSLLPILAVGMAAALDTLRRTLRGRPTIALGLLAAPFMLFNLTLAEQVRRGLVPRDDTVDFPVLVGQGAQLVSDAVGFPSTWPASWVFAWRHGRPPGQYDRLVGRYLFYRQNNLGGHVEVGAAEHEALLGEGWGPIESFAGRRARRARDAARLFAPLDAPEDLQVRFRTATDADGRLVRVAVNGRETGRFLAGAEWAEHALSAPAALWRRELNDVTLLLPEGVVLVSDVLFVRSSRVASR